MLFTNLLELRLGPNGEERGRWLLTTPMGQNRDAMANIFDPNRYLVQGFDSGTHLPDLRNGIRGALRIAEHVRAWLEGPGKPGSVPESGLWHFHLERLATAVGREAWLEVEGRASVRIPLVVMNDGHSDQHLWAVDAASRGFPEQYVALAREQFLAAFLAASALQAYGREVERSCEEVEGILPLPELPWS